MKETFLEHIKSDIESVKKRDPAARSTPEILLTYSGLHAIMMLPINCTKGNSTQPQGVSHSLRVFSPVLRYTPVQK